MEFWAHFCFIKKVQYLGAFKKSMILLYCSQLLGTHTEI